MSQLDLSIRHPAVQDAMRWLTPNPNLPLHLRTVSGIFYDAAVDLLADTDDCPQLTLALHRLVEAKDCAVRARLSMDPPAGS